MRDDEDLIKSILDWAADNPDFDTEFVESCNEYLERKGYLTDAQRAGLENIIEGFNIE